MAITMICVRSKDKKSRKLVFDFNRGNQKKKPNYRLTIDGQKYEVTERARQELGSQLDYHDWANHIAYGKDEKIILPGETVYGSDGQAWTVIGIAAREAKLDVLGRNADGVIKPLKSTWLSHSFH